MEPSLLRDGSCLSRTCPYPVGCRVTSLLGPGVAVSSGAGVGSITVSIILAFTSPEVIMLGISLKISVLRRDRYAPYRPPNTQLFQGGSTKQATKRWHHRCGVFGPPEAPFLSSVCYIIAPSSATLYPNCPPVRHSCCGVRVYPEYSTSTR
ncbi:unnamed protein product [Boreogadus saida]